MPSASSGKSSVIVEPAAMKAFSPMVTGAIRLALLPINALSFMVVRNLFLPS